MVGIEVEIVEGVVDEVLFGDPDEGLVDCIFVFLV